MSESEAACDFSAKRMIVIKDARINVNPPILGIKSNRQLEQKRPQW